MGHVGGKKVQGGIGRIKKCLKGVFQRWCVVRCEDGESRGWLMGGVGKRKGLVGLEEGQALALVAGGTMDPWEDGV